MEIYDYFSLFLGGLIGTAPALVFWIAVLIFAVIMRRRGGGSRAERFLIAGAIIKLTGSLLNIPTNAIPIWLRAEGYSLDSAVAIASNCNIFLSIVGMAGIICLLYAFWVKFKERNLEGEVFTLSLERGSHDAVPEY